MPTPSATSSTPGSSSPAGRPERDLVAAVASHCDSPPVQVLGGTSLGAVGAIYRRSRIVVGCDSGPLHIAAAVGAPTVHLFGPVDHRMFGPWGPAERHAVVRIDLPCAPCNRLDYCSLPDQSRACVLGITPALVLASARERSGVRREARLADAGEAVGRQACRHRRPPDRDARAACPPRASSWTRSIDLLATPHSADVVRGLSSIDHLLLFQKRLFDSTRALLKPGSIAEALRLGARLRGARYDAVLVCHHLNTRYGGLKYAALALATGRAAAARRRQRSRPGTVPDRSRARRRLRCTPRGRLLAAAWPSYSIRRSRSSGPLPARGVGRLAGRSRRGGRLPSPGARLANRRGASRARARSASLAAGRSSGSPRSRARSRAGKGAGSSSSEGRTRSELARSLRGAGRRAHHRHLAGRTSLAAARRGAAALRPVRRERLRPDAPGGRRAHPGRVGVRPDESPRVGTLRLRRVAAGNARSAARGRGAWSSGSTCPARPACTAATRWATPPGAGSACLGRELPGAVIRPRRRSSAARPNWTLIRSRQAESGALMGAVSAPEVGRGRLAPTV